MKSLVDDHFNHISKDIFGATLKPFGFKKKANNFYRPIGPLGHCINLQKGQGRVGPEIRFAINAGIFWAPHWQQFYNYQELPLPDFPKELDCFLRCRVGDLQHRDKNNPMGIADKWYEINEHASFKLADLEAAMDKVISEGILPYFNTLQTETQLTEAVLDSNSIPWRERLWYLVDRGFITQAQSLLDKTLAENANKPLSIIERFKSTAQEFGLKLS